MGIHLPIIVFTDNRSVTRSFQAQHFPPALWNACDYVLQNNLVIAHFASSVNTAADFLSRIEVNPTCIRLTCNDKNTKPKVVNIQSSGIVDEEQSYILSDDEINEKQH